MSKAIVIMLLFAMLLFLQKPAFADDDDDEFFAETPMTKIQTNNLDPFESFNRKIFSFNVVVYDKMLVPFSDWYNDKIPLEIRFTFKNIMQNFYTNTKDITLSVFDFDIEAILTSFWRWTTNSVFGVFGGDDVAHTLGLFAYEKSVGNILYFYHIPRGPYLMLPILGPSNMRDGIGLMTYTIMASPFCWRYIFQTGDYAYVMSYLNVVSFWHILFHSNRELIWIGFFHSTGYMIHRASTLGTTIRFLSSSAIDRYTSFRTAYFLSLEKDEEKYMKKRMEGNGVKNNVCDYDAMVELPEECESDPKTYDFSV